MVIGFTGTRDGLTEKQSRSLVAWLTQNAPFTAAHHGDCVGADSHFHSACRNLEGYTKMHLHPCDLDNFRAGRDADVMYQSKPPLARNKDIVAKCDVLLACPKGPEEQRSGTWSTVRVAKRAKKRAVIFWPDGTVEER